MPHPHAHVSLGKDDPVRADALEDTPVRLRHGLRDDPGDAEVGKHRGREDARLDLGADRDDRRLELARAELAHGPLVRRVRLDNVREDAREFLDELRVGVDAEHLVAHADKGRRETTAEAAQPDDDELFGSHGSADDRSLFGETVEPLPLSQDERDAECMRPDAAEIHERDQDPLTCRGDVGSDSGREAHGSEGRERLEERSARA